MYPFVFNHFTIRDVSVCRRTNILPVHVRRCHVLYLFCSCSYPYIILKYYISSYIIMIYELGLYINITQGQVLFHMCTVWQQKQVLTWLWKPTAKTMHLHFALAHSRFSLWWTVNTSCTLLSTATQRLTRASKRLTHTRSRRWMRVLAFEFCDVHSTDLSLLFVWIT